MNNLALERARLLFKQHGKKVKCINKSIFELKKKGLFCNKVDS
jgi:hypothetical protein